MTHQENRDERNRGEKCRRRAWRVPWRIPNVTRPELKVRERPFFIPTLHVRKRGKCHREAWKAGWEFPNVTRQEPNWRERPIFVLTLHVRNTGRSQNRTGKLHNRTGRCQGGFVMAIWKVKWQKLIGEIA